MRERSFEEGKGGVHFTAVSGINLSLEAGNAIEYNGYLPAPPGVLHGRH